MIAAASPVPTRQACCAVKGRRRGLARALEPGHAHGTAQRLLFAASECSVVGLRVVALRVSLSKLKQEGRKARLASATSLADCADANVKENSVPQRCEDLALAILFRRGQSTCTVRIKAPLRTSQTAKPHLENSPAIQQY